MAFLEGTRSRRLLGDIMAAFDWNGDGKNDIYDDMLELHNAKQSMNKKQDYDYSDKKQNYSESTGDFKLSALTYAAAIILGVLATFRLATKVDMKSPVVALTVFVIATFAALFLCGIVQAIIEGFKKK